MIKSGDRRSAKPRSGATSPVSDSVGMERGRPARPDCVDKPVECPERPWFSSGPCAKPANWSLEALDEAQLARSHRASPSKEKLLEVIERSRDILRIPSDYRLAIVPGSDTGALEMALWNLLGARGVDALAWESFGSAWAADMAKELKLPDLRILDADYGDLPDLTKVDGDRDVVFTWNGTTSGACVPNADWLAPGRKGLAICDATSAVFAMAIPLEKLDVVTWSWQKALGGEAAHGMLLLSPRAVERLESYQPPWPIPKLFRLTKNGKIIEGLFRGETINTPSMLCVEDTLMALRWAHDIGGCDALQARSRANLETVETWVAQRDWIDFLARSAGWRSSTSICLRFTAPWFTALDLAAQSGVAREISTLIADADAGYDLGSYRDAPPGLRIWGGPTVETADVERLLPWIDWAYGHVSAQYKVAA